jgi:hypothetical protein
MGHRSEVMHHEVDQELRRPCEFLLKRKEKPLMTFIQFSSRHTSYAHHDKRAAPNIPSHSSWICTTRETCSV